MLYPHIASIKSLSDSVDVAVLQQTPTEMKSQSVVDTVGKDCSVHLSLVGLNVTDDQNKYSLKQDKLSKELEKIIRISSTDGYKTKASPKVQKSQCEKVRLNLNFLQYHSLIHFMIFSISMQCYLISAGSFHGKFSN